MDTITRNKRAGGRHALHPALKLKGLLVRHGIQQVEVARLIVQPNGHPMSKSAMAQLCGHGIWPVTTPREQIIKTVENHLRAAGVPEAEIATAWEEGARFHFARPIRSQSTYIPPLEIIDPIGETEMLKPAAKKLFQLFRDPFQDDVSGAEDVFLAPDQRYIREAMFVTARHGGFLAVVGESGAGKSVLRRDLLDRIAREQAPISVVQPRTLDKSQLNAAAIFEAIIDDLLPGSKIRRTLEGRSRQAEQLLRNSSRAGNTHVLLIEEAHDLSISTLKVLKRFWEIEDGFKKLLGIILVGQPELKMKLDERHNFEAREVIRRCEIAELMPLDGMLEAYVAHKFKRVGKAADEVMAAGAYDAIRQRLTRRNGQTTLSMLYPLVVNNLLTKAMNYAAEIGEERITADVIRAL